MDYLVSIIIPVYNVEKYLAQCLDSVCSQTYRKIEIIIVNDGSTDGSDKIIERYAKLDHRIIVIHKKNGGLSEARNYGLDCATGKYVMFVDSDDFIAPEMTEYLVREIQRVNAQIAVCGYRPVDEKGGFLPPWEIFPERKVVSPKGFWEIHHKEAYMYGVVAWNKLYDRNIFKKLRYPVGKIHEDVFLLHKVVHCTQRIVCCPKELYYYRQRCGSIMNNGSGKAVKELFSLDALQAFIIRLEYFIGREMFDEASYAFAQAARQVVNGYEVLQKLSNTEKKRLFIYHKRLKRLARNCRHSKISPVFRIEVDSFLIDRRCFQFLRVMKKMVTK
ncbi:MAG: glycosyltransferase family 2 protein [Lachnospiraceae bacterium]|nr:glycosyltransferase family 2 protein [Lachnospiraceae bacterium]